MEPGREAQIRHSQVEPCSMKGLTVGHLLRLGGPGRTLCGGEAGAGGWAGFPCLKGGLEGDPSFAENF